MNMKFSKNAVDALNAASSCARQLGHDHIGTEHIFLSILAIPSCQAAKRLVALGMSLEDLSESMRSMISGGAAGTPRIFRPEAAPSGIETYPTFGISGTCPRSRGRRTPA